MQEQLYKNIFSKAHDDADNASMLTSVTQQYPYFGAAQFYLLKNTAAEHSDQDHIAAKTALFFNDPFLLNLRLKKVVSEKETVINETSSTEQPVTYPSMDKVSEETVVSEEIAPEPSTEEIPVVPAQPAAVEKEELLFEPLHATDYFASQGIKLSDTVLPNDKLGMQLKSFTSWLKTMKKAHPEKVTPATAVNDAVIQNMAEKSNQEEDIITEAMAEAYIQQGKTEKARDVWQKLSLQNPAKSAYFAAKIESLKQ